MDLRIVNTCNNNCLFCLEQGLRNKNKFISKDFLFEKIKDNREDKIMNFYGGNPLLHPDLLDIIKFCKLNEFEGIGILSNTYLLNYNLIKELKINGLNSFGFYFNTFNKENHELINGNGVSYDTFLSNLNLLKKSGLFLKVIIHINKSNIDTIARDIVILSKKYGIKVFDFINYFPFDRPYKNKSFLEYNFLDKRHKIERLFIIIKKLNLNVNFVKFSKDFFGKSLEYYSFEKGILKQIGYEDMERMKGSNKPFCFNEKRCNNCFIKDKCEYYEL